MTRLLTMATLIGLKPSCGFGAHPFICIVCGQVFEPGLRVGIGQIVSQRLGGFLSNVGVLVGVADRFQQWLFQFRRGDAA